MWIEGSIAAFAEALGLGEVIGSGFDVADAALLAEAVAAVCKFVEVGVGHLADLAVPST